MASAAQRHLDASIIKTICTAGGKVLEKGVDGAGHTFVSFVLNGWPKSYHYAHSAQGNGCGPLNTITRLRRIIREMPKTPPEAAPDRPRAAAPPVSVVQSEPRYLPPPPTPPQSTRLTKERRKEIAKRYLGVSSIDALLEEYPIGRTKLETLILSQRGQAADKLKHEQNTKRMAAARLLRELTRTPIPALPAPMPTITRQERDRRIRKLYTSTTHTLKEIGRRFGISASNAWRIAHK